MRTKIYLVTLLIAFVTIFGLTACMNEDEPKDITKEVTMYVSSETGIMYDLFDSEGDFPIECMLVKEQGEDEYRPLAFCGIQGFEYEKAMNTICVSIRQLWQIHQQTVAYIQISACSGRREKTGR